MTLDGDVVSHTVTDNSGFLTFTAVVPRAQFSHGEDSTVSATWEATASEE